MLAARLGYPVAWPDSESYRAVRDVGASVRIEPPRRAGTSRPSSASVGAEETMTIRLVSTETYSKVFTDRPPIEQNSKGDVILVGSTLRNAVAQFGRPKGAVVGDDIVIFTIRTPEPCGCDRGVEPSGRLAPSGGSHALGRQADVPGDRRKGPLHEGARYG